MRAGTFSRSIGVAIVAVLATAPPALSKRCDDVLHYGTPESVGMLPKPLEDMVANLTHFTETRNWTSHSYNQVVPVEPGGTVLIGHKGTIVSHFAFGKRNLWASVDGTNGTKLAPELQEDATVDTIYDMASLTKMFTTVAALRCIDRGLLALNGTVATWLPDFASNGKGKITLLQLLTHTSGLAPDPSPGCLSPYIPRTSPRSLPSSTRRSKTHRGPSTSTRTSTS